MDDIIKSVRAHSDEAAAIAELLYGDGAWEIAKSLKSDEDKRNRTQARIGLASNAVGLAAGAAGLTSAMKDDRLAGGGRIARRTYKIGSGIEGTAKKTRVGRAYYTKVATPRVAAAMAGGAVGLQVANLAGDAIANRVLARSAKKQVSKSDQAAQIKGKLVKVGVDSSFAAAKKAPTVANKVKEVVAKAHVDELDIVWEGEISKVDDDKRQVFGWASVVSMGGVPVVDLQGDYMDMETIEKAAYDYVHSSRKGGDMHERVGSDPRHVSDLIESFVVTAEKKKLLGLPEDMPEGWLVGFQVHDDDTWNLVKSGKRKGFSIHGSGKRVDHVLEDA